MGRSSGGQNRTPTPAACPHSRFFLGCAAPTPLCPLLSPHWDELGGSGFAHLQPQLRGRAQCHAPHAPPVPTPPCKGRGWPYMARPPAVVFLLLQIPLIPPESSRRQAVTGEESYSRGASLSVRPPQNTETPAGYVCDIMGWVATATGVMEMVAIVRAAPAPGISDGHLGFLHRWGNKYTSPNAAGWHRTWRWHRVLSQPQAPLSPRQRCAMPQGWAQVGRQQHSPGCVCESTPALGVRFPREGIIFTG